MNIEGTICRLRALEPEDIDAMYRWENDTGVWRVSGTTAPFSRHALARFIEEQRFDIFATRQLRLVIEAGGTCGGAYTAEVSGAAHAADSAVAAEWAETSAERVAYAQPASSDAQNPRGGNGPMLAEATDGDAVRTFGHASRGSRAATFGRVAVGAVDLFEFDPQNMRAGVGILVAEPFRRSGYAADALDALEHYCRTTLRLHQMWCGIGEDNTASLRLFAAAGFSECGRRREWLLAPDGSWRDEILMQKIL